MKKRNVLYAAGMALLFAFAFAFSACSEDDDPIPAEAKITAFAITNAGADGDLRVEGDISNLNILVVVPFETDVTALITDITLSSGASVVPASGTPLDFSEPRSFVVTNQDASNTYQVTVEKDDPTEGSITGIVLKNVVTNDIFPVEILQAEKKIVVTFNELQSTVVVIESISLLPPGATYTTSTESDTLDLAQDVHITVSFAGEDVVYDIETNITEAGFDPDNYVALIDRSSASGLVPSYISTENNRGAAFDGRYLFVASRQEGNHVYYWDMEQPSADPKTLDFGDVVSGGTWAVSDIRVVGGNIYVSNMVMNEEQVFKLYKWEDVDDAAPELILSYTVPDEDIRLGDAISIIGNPPVNGYVFASNFAWPNNASEFYVWDFNGQKEEVSPYIMPINPIEGMRIGQYGRVNTIPGEPELLLVTGAEMGVGVMDFEGNIIYETFEPMVQTRSYDPLIWEYNDGLYLSFTVNREWEGQGAWYEIINISEGATFLDALEALSDDNIDEKRVFKHVFGGPGALWVGGTHGVGFSPEGKPRVMGFALMHGFIVHEFSN